MVDRKAELLTKLDSVKKRDPAILPDGIPAKFVKCKGNRVFKCSEVYHDPKQCKRGTNQLKELKASLTHHDFHRERDKPSLKKCILNLSW